MSQGELPGGGVWLGAATGAFKTCALSCMHPNSSMVKKKYLILKDSFALISSVVLGELQFYLLLDLGFGKPYGRSLFFSFYMRC